VEGVRLGRTAGTLAAASTGEAVEPGRTAEAAAAASIGEAVCTVQRKAYQIGSGRGRTLKEGREKEDFFWEKTQSEEESLPRRSPHGAGPFQQLRDRQVTVEDFLPSEKEKAASKNHEVGWWANVLRRERSAIDGVKRADLRDELAQAAKTRPEIARVFYVSVDDLKVSNETDLMITLERLRVKFEVGTRVKYLVVGGDQQTWKLVDDLKYTYGEAYSWLKHYPGDWHCLLNAQEAFKKGFYEGGMLDLATEMGFKKSTARGALLESKNFDRNYLFIMQTAEGFGRFFLEQFLRLGAMMYLREWRSPQRRPGGGVQRIQGRQWDLGKGRPKGQRLKREPWNINKKKKVRGRRNKMQEHQAQGTLGRKL
jgi:hypothetical protein